MAPARFLQFSMTLAFAAHSACAVASEPEEMTWGVDAALSGALDAGQSMPSGDASSPSGETPPEAVYAHSDSTLFKLHPSTLEITTIGSFSGCSTVVDIAVNKDSEIFASSTSGLFKVNPETGACLQVASGAYPNSLSFVPAGTLDPMEEVLVAYDGNTYMRIDGQSGQKTIIGSIGGGYASSGDIVSVENGGTYLTARGNGCADCLFEIDPLSGSLVKNWGPIGHHTVYGLAYWGGIAYGFNSLGTAFQIHFGANDISTTTVDFPSPPNELAFWGAGSTTRAPLVID